MNMSGSRHLSVYPYAHGLPIVWRQLLNLVSQFTILAMPRHAKGATIVRAVAKQAVTHMLGAALLLLLFGGLTGVTERGVRILAWRLPRALPCDPIMVLYALELEEKLKSSRHLAAHKRLLHNLN